MTQPTVLTVISTAALVGFIAYAFAIRRGKAASSRGKADVKLRERQDVVVKCFATAVVSTGDQAKSSLGAFLCAALPREFPSRKLSREMIKRQQILLDGVVTEDDAIILQLGQRVDYIAAVKPKRHLARSAPPPSMRLDWAHVDDWLAICVKPQGVAVQGDSTAQRLNHAVAWALPPPSSRPDPLHVASFCHRLDKATGGLLVFARTKAANALICQAFSSSEEAAAEGCSTADRVQKTYLAIVAGKLEGSGVVDSPVQTRRAVSRWESLSCVESAASGWITTVRLQPETGRYHQLRRHLALELGCPILGDPKYLMRDSRSEELHGCLHLWAAEIALPHPEDGKLLRVSIGEPPLFPQRRAAERKAFERVSKEAWEEAVALAEARRGQAPFKLGGR